jgi:hypothetical protein
MAVYFRKSVKAGPFRFNFSKGGVGVSVGVKGFRIGTGPRGHYVHAGLGGIYYRASLGNAGESRPPYPAQEELHLGQFLSEDGVEMVEVTSTNIHAMREESFSDLLDEINAKAKQVSMASLLGWSFGIFGLIAGMGAGSPGIGLAFLAFPAWG